MNMSDAYSCSVYVAITLQIMVILHYGYTFMWYYDAGQSLLEQRLVTSSTR